MRPRQQRRRSTTTGTVLVLVGIAAVLGTTFAAGVYAGRLSPRGGDAAHAARAAERDGRRVDARADRRRPEGPTLTFYQELTAPLTPPSTPPRRPGRPKPVAVPAEPPTSGAIADGGERTVPAVSTRPTALAEQAPPALPGYTVQVAAYRAREPAERLRASLAAAGHDAQIVEIEAPGVARYRVRVGAFATREAARQAAARIAGERSLSTFVTAR